MNHLLKSGMWSALAAACTLSHPLTAWGQNGACCEESVDCIDFTENQCDALGGVWLGAGTSCENNDCDFGACCFEGGGCQDMLKGLCTQAGGTFQSGAFCGSNPCGGGGGLGACCASQTPGASCEEDTQESCDALGRVFIGEGVPCEPNPCGGNDPLRACCHGEGCSEITQEFCETIAGTWLPTITACSEFTCAPGACCTEGGCEEVLETQCNSAGGEWFIFQSCDPDPCESGMGACCAGQTPTSFCYQDTQVNCENDGRFFHGVGVACDPSPCSPCSTCEGDANLDAVLDGQDVQAFVGCLIESDGGVAPEGCECADMDHDGNLTTSEIPAWVANLLGNTGSCGG